VSVCRADLRKLNHSEAPIGLGGKTIISRFAVGILVQAIYFLAN
jgi:hypothetical protein